MLKIKRKMKLEKLTPEQEALIPIFRDKWINQLYDLKPLNEPQLLKGVKWLYNFCKLETPKVIICESILEAQLTVMALKDMANVRANVWDNVWANVRDNVGANVGANVGVNVRVNVRVNVQANVQANVGANYQPLCSYGDINDYSWVAFHDFFTEIGITNNPDFNSFKELLQSNYYSMIQMDKVCIVIKYPKHILLNEGRLNSTKDYAIKWLDDTGMYFVNGFYLSDELFNKLSKKEYTFDDFTKEQNEEVKSAVVAYYQQEFGDEYLFRFFSEFLKEADSFVDKKDEQYLKGTTNGMNIGVYTLFKGKINSIDIAYVRCYCPSTDRMFFLGVSPENTTAKDAIASLYRIPRKLVKHIKAINRQGERMSTTFTESGLSLVENLPKEDIEDLVSISGDDYFKLMKYEF